MYMNCFSFCWSNYKQSVEDPATFVRERNNSVVQVLDKIEESLLEPLVDNVVERVTGHDLSGAIHEFVKNTYRPIVDKEATVLLTTVENKVEDIVKPIVKSYVDHVVEPVIQEIETRVIPLVEPILPEVVKEDIKEVTVVLNETIALIDK